MLSFKLLQHLHLPGLLRRRLPHLLLPLIIHHFLHHAPCLPVQIAQLTILRLDLCGVDEVGRIGRDGGPPLHFVGFVEMKGDLFAGGDGFESPS
jgi:hypothetical protein